MQTDSEAPRPKRFAEMASLMGVVSLVFLATTLGTALAIRLTGAHLPRETLFILASVLFIFGMSSEPQATLPFWALVCTGFLIVRAAPHAQAPVALAGLLGLVVFTWWALRTLAPEAIGVAPDGTVLFGLSYAMFRIIHLAVDARDDQLGAPLTFRSYLCYLIFFPNYLAGPVQRYQDFAPQVQHVESSSANAANIWQEAGQRAIAGIFKSTILAGCALQLHGLCSAAIGDQSDTTQLALLLAGAALGFAAGLYFSFSGYMDVVISAGRIIGVRIPENFATVWQARNFLDFWSRWHITLSDWFKIYVFNPLLKTMLARTERPNLAPYLGTLGYFLTFFLMGIWHGRSTGLIVYGIVLGAGVSINKLYQTACSKRLGKRAYAALCARPAYQRCAQSLALGYFALALAFLWQTPPDVTQLPWAAICGAVLLLWGTCAVLTSIAESPRISQLRFSTGMARFLLVAEALAAAIHLWWMNGETPPLIYQWL